MEYTLCFITKGEEVLLLLREKEPNKGKWNGVGGKIEAHESLEESCIREVYEETGLRIEKPIFKGVLSFNGAGGIALFVCNHFNGEIRHSSEGVLQWKHLNWITKSDEVVDNIRFFIRDVIDLNSEPKIFDFSYSQNGELINFMTTSMTEEEWRNVHTYRKGI